MTEGLDFDVKQFVLSNSTFGPREADQISEAVACDFSKYASVRDATGELAAEEELSPATSVRLGVCNYILGRYGQAIVRLKKGDGGALAHFYLGRAYCAKQEYSNALASFEAAQTAGYPAEETALAQAGARRELGQFPQAMEILDGLSGPVEQTAEYLYQRGATVSALGGNSTEVVALYERAVKVDAHHCGALFGLAMENDRHGNDDEARRLYEQSVSRYPAHVGSLLNLGILYEDQEQYDKAQECYDRILESFPNHVRANLYFKDAQASRDMFIDEEAQKRRDRLSQILSTPVADFELSVRSRNCLQKMGISSLGDLTRCAESQLLHSKNFGETSLVEIREMLHSKGLELGQFADKPNEPEETEDLSQLSAEEIASRDRPIAELNLSVRARKCMTRLGISTIGELVRHTGDELLGSKNFGVTSLNEVREKLALQGLKVRGD